MKTRYFHVMEGWAEWSTHGAGGHQSPDGSRLVHYAELVPLPAEPDYAFAHRRAFAEAAFLGGLRVQFKHALCREVKMVRSRKSFDENPGVEFVVHPDDIDVEPDYSRTDYQERVLVASFRNVPCEGFLIGTEEWGERGTESIAHWIDRGWKIRIKPPHPQFDPYADLKAAKAAGKVIQTLLDGKWIDTEGDSYLRHDPQFLRVKPETVPLEARDWLNGPWYICTEPAAPNRILDMVITFSDVSITIGTHGCEPKLCSIHCSDYGKIFRTRDGVNFEPCSKEAK